MVRAKEEMVTFRAQVENLKVFLVIETTSFILCPEINTQDKFLMREVS